MGKRVISEEIIESYCTYLQECERSRGTIQKYRHCLELFREFLYGRAVGKALVVQWKDSLKRCLSTSTVNGAIAALNGLFRYLGWKDCVTRFFKTSRRIFCSEERELERQEYERLVMEAERMGDERMAVLLQTIAATGIRVSELRYITAEAVRSGAAELDNKGRIRRILLTGGLRELLKRYMARHDIHRGPLFITRNGNPMVRSNIWRAMKRLGAQCGVAESKVFPHNLRHLFARTYYDQEKDLSRLADILGHSSVNTTRIYTMESGKEHARQLEKLNLLITDNRMYLPLYPLASD